MSLRRRALLAVCDMTYNNKLDRLHVLPGVGSRESEHEETDLDVFATRSKSEIVDDDEV